MWFYYILENFLIDILCWKSLVQQKYNFLHGRISFSEEYFAKSFLKHKGKYQLWANVSYNRTLLSGDNNWINYRMDWNPCITICKRILLYAGEYLMHKHNNSSDTVIFQLLQFDTVHLDRNDWVFIVKEGLTLVLSLDCWDWGIKV